MVSSDDIKEEPSLTSFIKHRVIRLLAYFIVLNMIFGFYFKQYGFFVNFIIYPSASFIAICVIISALIILSVYLKYNKNNFIVYVQMPIYLFISGIISYLFFPYVSDYIESNSVYFDLHQLIVEHYILLLFLFVSIIFIDLSYICVRYCESFEQNKYRSKRKF